LSSVLGILQSGARTNGVSRRDALFNSALSSCRAKKMVGPDGVHPPGPSLLFGKKTRKPNSVYAVIPLGAALPRTLISDLPGGSGHCMEQPFGAGPAPGANLAPDPRFPPYLVLLRVGFTLPPALLAERCALTAPFHPYHCVGQPSGQVHRGSQDALPKEG